MKVVGLDMVAERCRLAEKAGAIAVREPRRRRIWPRSKTPWPRRQEGSAPTRCSWWPAAAPTGRWSWPRRLARDRATVVDIGKCKLDLPWNAYYEKELDVRFSRSYGPGRYDPHVRDRRRRLPGRLRALDRTAQPGCFVDLIASR